jgi:hypothetical protein
MRNIILFLTMIFLFSCAANHSTSDCEKLNLHCQDEPFVPLELPNWFINMPQEPGLAIGIAATNSYKPESTNLTIKESASIISSRNKSAIVIAKLKMKENQTVLTPIISEFNLQLSSDIPELKRYYNNSKIINRTELCGMTIGIVGEKTSDITLDESIYISKEPPLWYTDFAYSTEDNYLISCGKSSSINMATAYNNAYQEAVHNLITGIKPRVKSAIINSQNYIETFVEIDASVIIENMSNSRNFLVLRRSDNSYIYDGYVELKWQPQYKVQQIKIKD